MGDWEGELIDMASNFVDRVFGDEFSRMLFLDLRMTFSGLTGTGDAAVGFVVVDVVDVVVVGADGGGGLSLTGDSLDFGVAMVEDVLVGFFFFR